ncbi:MAG: cytochrome P450, partial [Acidobacteriota bacterium]
GAPYRKAAGASFAPGRGGAGRGVGDGRADRLLDALAGEGPVDLVSDYAHPLTCGHTCSLLGVPEGELGVWSERLGRLDGGYLRWVGADLESPELGDDGAWLLRAVDRLLDRGDGLAGRLAAVGGGGPGDGAGEGDRRGFLRDLLLLLLYAGHQNMVNFLSLAVFNLCRHPELVRRLRREPSRLPDAVLELMRYDSPVQYLPLVARDAIDVGGERIGPGDEILISVGAANRDPEVFPNPDRIDLDRRPREQLSFGWGPSRCMGAQLAVSQGAAALGAWLARTEAFELTGEELRWRTVPAVQRGLHALPLDVRWRS